MRKQETAGLEPRSASSRVQDQSPALRVVCDNLLSMLSNRRECLQLRPVRATALSACRVARNACVFLLAFLAFLAPFLPLLQLLLISGNVGSDTQLANHRRRRLSPVAWLMRRHRMHRINIHMHHPSRIALEYNQPTQATTPQLVLLSPAKRQGAEQMGNLNPSLQGRGDLLSSGIEPNPGPSQPLAMARGGSNTPSFYQFLSQCHMFSLLKQEFIPNGPSSEAGVGTR